MSSLLGVFRMGMVFGCWTIEMAEIEDIIELYV